MKVITSFTTLEEAHLVVARLQDAGIAASVRDELTVSTNWLWSNAVGGIRVEVPDDEVADAQAILGEKPAATGLLLCPHCGSSDIFVRPLSAFAAVLIVFKIPLPLRSRTIDCRSCKRIFEVQEPDKP